MGSCCSVTQKTSFFRSHDGPVPACEAMKRRQEQQQRQQQQQQEQSPPGNQHHQVTPLSSSSSSLSSSPSPCLPQTMDDLRAFGRDTLQTGDILLMHCTHTFGKVTQVATNSVWDHVAMVVRLDDCMGPENDDNENNNDENNNDNENNHKAQYLQARMALLTQHPLPPSRTVGEWPLPGQSGPVEVFEAMAGGAYAYPFVEHAIARGKFAKYTAVRRLRRHGQSGQPLSYQQRQKLVAFVHLFWARPFESVATLHEVVRPVLRRKPPQPHVPVNKKRENLTRVFCSELLVAAYQYAGLLPTQTLNANDVLPRMFAPGKAIDVYLTAQSHGYTLSDVQMYKSPQTPLYKAIVQERQHQACRRRNNDDNKQTTPSLTRTISQDLENALLVPSKDEQVEQAP